jgi:hypothetical protein
MTYSDQNIGEAHAHVYYDGKCRCGDSQGSTMCRATHLHYTGEVIKCSMPIHAADKDHVGMWRGGETSVTWQGDGQSRHDFNRDVYDGRSLKSGDTLTGLLEQRHQPDDRRTDIHAAFKLARQFEDQRDESRRQVAELKAQLAHVEGRAPAIDINEINVRDPQRFLAELSKAQHQRDVALSATLQGANRSRARRDGDTGHDRPMLVDISNTQHEMELVPRLFARRGDNVRQLTQPDVASSRCPLCHQLFVNHSVTVMPSAADDTEKIVSWSAHMFCDNNKLRLGNQVAALERDNHALQQLLVVATRMWRYDQKPELAAKLEEMKKLVESMSTSPVGAVRQKVQS